MKNKGDSENYEKDEWMEYFSFDSNGANFNIVIFKTSLKHTRASAALQHFSAR